MAVAVLLVMLAAAPGTLGETTRAMMVDAFLGVSSFVAAALLLLYGLERVLGFDLARTMREARGGQVPLAALLGAMPGCGGAVVVVAAYAAGNVGFGALVATLVATMGDAAFLLLARRPDAAAVVLPVALVVGTLSGWLVDARGIAPKTKKVSGDAPPPSVGRTRPRDLRLLAVVLPGLALGIVALTGRDPEALVGATAVTAVGLVGTLVCLGLWATSPLKAMAHPCDSPVTRTAEEASFVAVWIIAAFLAYEYAVVFAGLDLAPLFATVAPALPAIAIAIGFIPGCGPQILVATLYVNGVLPFSALIGNALANDGDALFPAIALEPRAALWATLYSALPALAVAYAFELLAPGFLH